MLLQAAAATPVAAAATAEDGAESTLTAEDGAESNGELSPVEAAAAAFESRLRIEADQVNGKLFVTRVELRSEADKYKVRYNSTR